jgi:cell division protein FtsW
VRRLSSVLMVMVAALLAVGVVMLASTSSVRASANYQDPYYFLKRQLVWVAIALGLGLAVLRFDYHWWQKAAVPLAAFSLALLVIVLVPGVGARIGGSSRWLRLGPFSFQPSEMAKVSLVIGMATWMSRLGRKTREFIKGLLLPVGGLGVLLGLLLLEPDFGTTLLLGMVGMLILFVGGTRIVYLSGVAMMGLAGFGLAVAHDPVRLRRILAFLYPDKFPEVAYHLAQSEKSFTIGRLFGVGLGNSIQKQFYLPEAHTDFILAIIGEELGLIGTIAVVLLFAGILFCGVRISLKAPDLFGRLLGFGFTMLIGLQAAINIGVVTGCLPTKGLPLPFISYGGSSMLASIAGICILCNIAQHVEERDFDEHTQLIRDRAHQF